MTEDWLKALLGKPDEKWKLAKLKEEHPYVADLIGLLLPYRNNGMRRSMVLRMLEKERKNAGLPIPPTFEQSVQSAYNGHCFDSLTFRRPESEALFYSPEGKGSGKWAVNAERAQAWLEKRLGAISNELPRS